MFVLQRQASMLQSSRGSVLGFCTALLLLVAGGCQNFDGSAGMFPASSDLSDSGSSDGIEYPSGPLHPDTLLGDDEPCIESVTLSEDREMIGLFLLCSAQDFGLEPGRIVLGSSDGGFLRRIESIETAGEGEVILRTRFATLAEAFTDVEISERWAFGSREVVDFAGRTLQGGAGQATQIEVQSGMLQVNPDLGLDVDFGFLTVKKATAILKLGLNVEIDALFRHEAGDESGGLVELQTIHHPLEMDVGPSQLQGELVLVIRLGYRNLADGPGLARMQMNGTGTVELGGTWTKPDQWESHWVPSFDGQVLPLQVRGEGAWEGEVAVQIDAQIKLQKVEGSSFRFEAYSAGTSGSDCDPEKAWSSAGGLRGEATMRLGFFDDGPREEHMPELDEVLEPLEGIVTAADGACDDSLPSELPGDDDPAPGDEDLPPGEESGSGSDADSAGTAAPECSGATPISCGAMVAADTSSSLATSLVDGYSEVVGNYEAAEQVYSWTASVSGPVEFRLVDPTPMVVDHDVFVLDAGAGACLEGDFVAYGFHTASFEAVAGTSYLLIVDGYGDDVGSFTAELDCSP